MRLLADALNPRSRSGHIRGARHQSMCGDAWGSREADFLAVFPRGDAPERPAWPPAGFMDPDVKYEYKTLRLYAEAPPAMEEEWSDVLNNEARCGWRLVTVHDSVAFLERGITDAYSESPSRFA
ncbi:DUF4177 domain-containing protein [Sphaerisporangium sp. NPDC049002]|uniref:DUF4177 domain-containing protein n=1 Tax=unclassified Sphaerisporangium TaxID=2630420 RepID=UPI00340AA3DB